jgi:hypothetical protein
MRRPALNVYGAKPIMLLVARNFLRPSYIDSCLVRSSLLIFEGPGVGRYRIRNGSLPFETCRERVEKVFRSHGDSILARVPCPKRLRESVEAVTECGVPNKIEPGGQGWLAHATGGVVLKPTAIRETPNAIGSDRSHMRTGAPIGRCRVDC